MGVARFSCPIVKWLAAPLASPARLVEDKFDATVDIPVLFKDSLLS